MLTASFREGVTFHFGLWSCLDKHWILAAYSSQGHTHIDLQRHSLPRQVKGSFITVTSKSAHGCQDNLTMTKMAVMVKTYWLKELRYDDIILVP